MTCIRTWWLVGVLSILSSPVLMAETITYPALGSVTVYQPAGAPKEFVIFVSGDGGWNLGVVSMAQQLVEAGAFVAGIDINQMGKRLQASSDTCANLAATFETFSHFVQQKYCLKRYESPILVGYSSGATVVYATLAQSPAGTFKGALSLGFCPDLEWSKPMCRGEGLEHDPGAKIGFVYRPATHLRDPWTALQGDQDQVCNAEQTRQFVAKVPGAKVVTLPKVGHGYSVERNWVPQFLEAFHGIADAPDAARSLPDPAEASRVDVVRPQSQGSSAAASALRLRRSDCARCIGFNRLSLGLRCR